MPAVCIVPFTKVLLYTHERYNERILQEINDILGRLEIKVKRDAMVSPVLRSSSSPRQWLNDGVSGDFIIELSRV